MILRLVYSLLTASTLRPSASLYSDMPSLLSPKESSWLSPVPRVMWSNSTPLDHIGSPHLADHVPVVARGNGDRVEGVGWGSPRTRTRLPPPARWRAGGPPRRPRRRKRRRRCRRRGKPRREISLSTSRLKSVSMGRGWWISSNSSHERLGHRRVLGRGHSRSPVAAVAAVVSSAWMDRCIGGPTSVEARRNAPIGAGRYWLLPVALSNRQRA